MRKKETFCSFIPLGTQQPGIDVLYESKSEKSFFFSGGEQNLRVRKTKNHAMVIFYLFAGSPPLGRLL